MAKTPPLESKYERFKALTFPGMRSDDDGVDELRAELIELDGHVAGLIGRLVGGAGLDEFTLRSDDDLRQRIADRIKDDDPRVVDDARRLLAYMEELDSLIAAASPLP